MSDLHDREDVVELDISREHAPVAFFEHNEEGKILTFGGLMEMFAKTIRDAPTGEWVETEFAVSSIDEWDEEDVESLRRNLSEYTDLSENVVQAVEVKSEGEDMPLFVRYET